MEKFNLSMNPLSNFVMLIQHMDCTVRNSFKSVWVFFGVVGFFIFSFFWRGWGLCINSILYLL